jgi:hypothetical protein
LIVVVDGRAVAAGAGGGGEESIDGECSVIASERERERERERGAGRRRKRRAGGGWIGCPLRSARVFRRLLMHRIASHI